MLHTQQCSDHHCRETCRKNSLPNIRNSRGDCWHARFPTCSSRVLALRIGECVLTALLSWWHPRLHCRLSEFVVEASIERACALAAKVIEACMSDALARVSFVQHVPFATPTAPAPPASRPPQSSNGWGRIDSGVLEADTVLTRIQNAAFVSACAAGRATALEDVNKRITQAVRDLAPPHTAPALLKITTDHALKQGESIVAVITYVIT